MSDRSEALLALNEVLKNHIISDETANLVEKAILVIINIYVEQYKEPDQE